MEVGSPGWFAWLATDAARSVSYRSPHGAYTARKERRQRGGVYWVAYRTAGGRQHKGYLGRAQDLTPRRLDEVAAALAERVAGAAADLGDVAPSTSVAGGVSPEADGSILLATKLFVPRPRPDLVQRPRCWPASTPASTPGGARCCRRRQAPARRACWPPGSPRWIARSPGSPSTNVTRTPVRSCGTSSPPCRGSTRRAVGERWPGSTPRGHHPPTWWLRASSTNWPPGPAGPRSGG